MSFDQALHINSADLSGIMRYQNVTLEPGGVYFFDFDGVLSSRFEDDIYRLQVLDEEKGLISEAAMYFGIRCDEMDWQYQRHLVYQAAASTLRIPIQPGPALNMAIEAFRIARVFVLTARSGWWYAVERFRSFLENWQIKPIETFHVGRVGKDRQLALVERELPHATIVFFEDNLTHLQFIKRAKLERVKLAIVQGEEAAANSEYLRNQFYKTVTTAIRGRTADLTSLEPQDKATDGSTKWRMSRTK
jgi:hypothetical protein